ncbi:hypothetical protein [Bradyrhizobium sp. NAS80.1]|uniref:hypothetical protein n=1 Tax=Bradyrhizobium sp. NAS80.1 TaxID=1680159 RepID=UPI001FD9220B|nr:hypothetical protein [Bradyrhizobium sp. NAS80.1]
MLEAHHPLVERFDAAVAAVEARWEELGWQPRKLDRRELMAYRGRAAQKGWRFAADFPGGLRHLDVIVSAGFPSTPARIALVDRPPLPDLASCREGWCSLPFSRYDDDVGGRSVRWCGVVAG